MQDEKCRMADECVRIGEMNRNLEKAYNQVAHELAHYKATRGHKNESDTKDKNLLRKYEEKILIMQEENQKMADCVRELDHT